jgi:hypothetical protein
MAVAFITPNSKLPGLNFDAPPGVRDLEYLFDQVFAGEQRARLQLLMGQYREQGPSHGVVDELNPNSATPASGRPLTVQPNAGNPLTLDITPGIAVTKAGNIIIIPEQLFGINLANNAVVSSDPAIQGIENIVLLEYLVVDDPETNTVTSFNTVEAVRRVTALPIDPALPQSTPETLSDPDLNKPQMVKVVTIQDFQDLTKFSVQRLNDCVVLAIVKVVPNPDAATYAAQPTILNIDMTNAVNQYVRPWFSAVDQEHRQMSGTGADTVPHKLSYNDLGGGALTLYQQMLQHGIVLSRDLNVPGCPGKICEEYVDGTPGVRVLTDATGLVTGTVGRRYVYLNSYPTRILGIRGNKDDGSGGSVPDTGLTAYSLAADLIPGTNILALYRQNATDEGFNSTYGFTVYYTDSDCLRPPALPHDVMLVAGDIIQFQNPTPSEEYVTGGKIYEALPTTQYAVGTNGPIPKNYRLWLDASQQFIEGPQVVSCAKLINDANGVGTAVQTPQFPMYGPARIRVALWNAPLSPPSNMEVQIELTGKDLTGAIAVETLIFHGTAGSAAPKQIAWEQTTIVNGEPTHAFQISNTVFSVLDTWKVKPTPVAAGANALIQLWADIEPTTTPALDDALPVCTFNWNGQSVARIHDTRPISRNLRDVVNATQEQEHVDHLVGNFRIMLTMMGGFGGATNTKIIGVESFKNVKHQDNILSRRDRHNTALDSVFTDEDLTATFNSEGTLDGAREWYYSQAFPLPFNQSKLFMVVFGDLPTSLESPGGDAVVEYQLYSAPTTAGAWTTMPAISGNARVRQITGLAGNFKIRFRMAGKKLSGFMLAALW